MYAIKLYNILYELTENTINKKKIKAICKFIATKLKNFLLECFKNIRKTQLKIIPYIVIDAKQSGDEEIKLIQQKLIELKIIK